MARWSLFLIPSGDDFSYTAGLILQLSGSCGSPPFEPHLTVCSGELVDLPALEGAAREACRGIPPFTLKVAGLVCGESYFRSLYIRFEQHPLLDRLQAGVEAAPGVEPWRRTVPHLSLLYGDLPLERRERLAAGIRLERREIRFDALKIVTPGNPREGWRDPRQWRTLARIGTEGALPGQPRLVEAV